MRVRNGARLAHRLHHRYPSLAPIAILERVAAERRIAISWYPFSRGVSGIMCMAAGGPEIGISTLNPPERQLFTLAHELGHALLGHRAGLLTGIPDDDDAEDERQANAFAAEFLMPAERVARWVAQGMALHQLCTNFGVSTEAMTRRLRELGLWRVVDERQRSRPSRPAIAKPMHNQHGAHLSYRSIYL